MANIISTNSATLGLGSDTYFNLHSYTDNPVSTTSDFTTTYPNIVPGSISGTEYEFGGSIADNGSGNIYASQGTAGNTAVATINYATGQVTDASGGNNYIETITYNYLTSYSLILPTLVVTNNSVHVRGNVTNDFNVVTTGTNTAGHFIGDGSGLTNLFLGTTFGSLVGQNAVNTLGGGTGNQIYGYDTVYTNGMAADVGSGLITTMSDGLYVISSTVTFSEVGGNGDDNLWMFAVWTNSTTAINFPTPAFNQENSSGFVGYGGGTDIDSMNGYVVWLPAGTTIGIALYGDACSNPASLTTSTLFVQRLQ